MLDTTLKMKSKLEIAKALLIEQLAPIIRESWRLAM
jgi:hypothetical protein